MIFLSNPHACDLADQNKNCYYSLTKFKCFGIHDLFVVPQYRQNQFLTNNLGFGMNLATGYLDR